MKYLDQFPMSLFAYVTFMHVADSKLKRWPWLLVKPEQKNELCKKPKPLCAWSISNWPLCLMTKCFAKNPPSTKNDA